MKILFPFLLLLVGTTATAQQHQTFKYTRLDDSTRQFKSDSHQIIFGNYKKSKNNLKVRRVTVNGEVYLFTLGESRVGLVTGLLDPSGATIGAIFATKDIVSRGTNLKWQNIDNNVWTYLENNKEVMRCSYQNSDSAQQIELTYDSTLPFVIQLAVLEQGLAKVKRHDYSGQERKVQFGIKGGANISMLSASFNSESSPRIGLSAGIYLKASMGKNAFFRPEIFYSSQGQKDKYIYSTGAEAGKTTTTLNYLNIPLLFELGKKVTVQTGLQVGVLLSAREKGTIGTKAIDDNIKTLMTKADASFVIGVGANLTQHVNIGARGNLGLSDIFKYGGLPDVKNRVLHYFIAYSF